MSHQFNARNVTAVLVVAIVALGRQAAILRPAVENPA